MGRISALYLAQGSLIPPQSSPLLLPLLFCYAMNMKQPVLLLIAGLPGSGKSTVAELLAPRLGYTLLSADPIEAAMLKSGLPRSFETGLAAYLVAEDLAGVQLAHRLSVIIDAVCAVQEARTMWVKLAERYQARLIILECVLASEIHRQRVETRVRNLYGLPEILWEDVERRREVYLPWQEKRLILDTAQEAAQILQQALTYISRESQREHP